MSQRGRTRRELTFLSAVAARSSELQIKPADRLPVLRIEHAASGQLRNRYDTGKSVGMAGAYMI
jgi:hypothetical protein